ncbi:MAG: N-acetylmuramoyl-L-alanine amidase [Bacteroidota bacterium]
MYRRLACFCLLWFCLIPPTYLWAQASTGRHVQAVAQPGDGVYSLLARYGVRTNCNLSYFYQLNQMKKGQYLKVGRSYSLPIVVYDYNGKSIRSTTGVNDMDWALSIQRYNEHLFSVGRRTQDFRDDRELWVPYSRLYCSNEELPLDRMLADESGEENGLLTSGASVGQKIRGTYAIFGQKYERVPLRSTQLSGKVYYLVSGHGGADPGAVGRRGGRQLCEDEYAYDITLRLAWNLLSYGATVYLITRDPNDGIRDGQYLPCDRDETSWGDVPIPASQKDRLFQRSDAVNTLYRTNRSRGVYHQRMVVIHVDSDRMSESTDMYFYFRNGDQHSRTLAYYLRETVEQKYQEVRKGRGYHGSVSTRDLHMLRETEPPAVFIELGNIRNSNDQARLVIERNRQLVADWLFAGLLKEAM